MQVDQLIVNVNSEQPEKLAAFYRDVVQLTPRPEAGPGAFAAGSAMFIVDGHDAVKGATKEPPRVLINFTVDDLASEQKRLEDQGVQFIRRAGKEPWGGVISTFVDPDGNYCQLIEYKP